jgi:ABC-2 type transport system ATP-binding protein
MRSFPSSSERNALNKQNVAVASDRSLASPRIDGTDRAKTQDAAVRVERLEFAYGKAGATRPALRGVDFEIGAGEIFGVLGPNGSGKTTLFRILATLVRPSGGAAQIFGRDVVREARAVRESIGVVFQAPSLDGKLTVIENLRHQGLLYGYAGRALEARVDEMLARSGLADRAGERAERLSGGLRRRAEIAKGLLHRPRLLLLDEPSAGLDPGVRRDLWTQLGELRAAHGMTIVVTTHLLDEAERCDRIAIMDRGKVVALGAPAALKERIGGDVVTIGAREPAAMRDEIRARYGGDPQVVDGTVRVERAAAHAWVSEIVESFPGRIESVTVARPTLEDVYVHETGHRFWDGAQIDEGGGARTGESRPNGSPAGHR